MMIRRRPQIYTKYIACGALSAFTKADVGPFDIQVSTSWHFSRQMYLHGGALNIATVVPSLQGGAYAGPSLRKRRVNSSILTTTVARKEIPANPLEVFLSFFSLFQPMPYKSCRVHEFGRTLWQISRICVVNAVRAPRNGYTT